MSNNKLKNGESYTLADLFSDDHKIVIPDMQREYCWGKEQIEPFFKNLWDASERPQTDLQLGMIYAYENPKNHIQLCDGQQRITTLYLLIGLLHRRLGSLQRYLISDFEQQEDDKECRLQYAIRESTLYFLNDLVQHFFCNSLAYEAIKKENWYFRAYDLDPSIECILSTLKNLESHLVSKSASDVKSFATFLMTKVKVLYFDMFNRERGEQLFVIINTTGEPLSIVEHLKPILLAKVDATFNQEWEERETYFWKHKRPSEQTTDEGLNDFLTWYARIKKKTDKDKVEPIKDFGAFEDKKKVLTELQQYFKAIPLLINVLQNSAFKTVSGKDVKTLQNLRDFQKEVSVSERILLPMLAFLVKFGNGEKDCDILLRRLRKQFHLKPPFYLDWRYILQIIETSNQIEEVLYFDTSKLSPIASIKLSERLWYDDEEKIKRMLKQQYKEQVEKWEDDSDFKGDLTNLFKMFLVQPDETQLPSFDVNSIHIGNFDELQRIYNNHTKLCRTELEYELYNWYRLFLLYSDCNPIQHIKQAAWDFEGGLFSHNNMSRFKNVSFYKLCQQPQDNWITYLRAYIKKESNHPLQDIVDKFDVKTFIKSWMLLKVLDANEHNKSVDSNNGLNNAGIAAYKNASNNRIFNDLPLSLGNMICGFGVKSGFGNPSRVRYTVDEYWLLPEIIDSPFASIDWDLFENSRKEKPKPISKDEEEQRNTSITENEQYMLRLWNEFHAT